MQLHLYTQHYLTKQFLLKTSNPIASLVLQKQVRKKNFFKSYCKFSNNKETEAINLEKKNNGNVFLSKIKVQAK